MVSSKPVGRPLIALLAALATAAALFAVPAGADPAAQAQLQGENLARLVVLLEGESVAAAVGSVRGPEADAHRAELAEQRDEYVAWMRRNAPQARVVWEYDTVLHGLSVELRGADASLMARGPHVREVRHPIWVQPLMNVSLPLIGWGDATGADFTAEGVEVGEGIAVGIIDTGIPVYEDNGLTHPSFAVTDANADFYVDGEDCTFTPVDDENRSSPNEAVFTNCKVPVARSYRADDPDATAEALHPHGSHVGGTVGGNSGTVDEEHDITVSGIAPAAVLGNYNVFPGEEAASASSDDIAAAVDDAVLDGMDLLNLSLGGGPPPQGWDVLELALRDAADAGVLSAVAAGNSGPGSETISSPGRAPWVITAGASTNPHFIGQEVSHEDLGTTGAAVGDFDAFDEDQPETAPIAWWGTYTRDGSGLACEQRLPRDFPDLSGQIALIERGECTFTTKIRNAEDAGAQGVIVFNNVAGDPTAMGHDGTDPFPAIPAVMIEMDRGNDLVDRHEEEVTAGGEISEQLSDNADIIAGFSSRGPAATPDGYIIKPDLTAPGVNVHSSTLCSEEEDGDTSILCEFAMFQGTSMASPHLAGAAAALFWDRAGWSERSADRVTEAKSAITNHADRIVTDHVTGDDRVGVNHQGAGRLQLDASWDAEFFADPVSISFGELRGGRNLEVTRSATLLGDTDGAVATVAERFDELHTVDVAVKADGNELVVTLTRPRGVRGTVEGWIEVTNGAGETISVPFWARLG